MTRRRIELVVNPIACDAHGVCSELLPELVKRDRWGYPVVSDRVITEDMLDHAKRAVRSCPRQALSLVQSPG